MQNCNYSPVWTLKKIFRKVMKMMQQKCFFFRIHSKKWAISRSWPLVKIDRVTDWNFWWLKPISLWKLGPEMRLRHMENLLKVLADVDAATFRLFMLTKKFTDCSIQIFFERDNNEKFNYMIASWWYWCMNNAYLISEKCYWYWYYFHHSNALQKSRKMTCLIEYERQLSQYTILIKYR